MVVTSFSRTCSSACPVQDPPARADYAVLAMPGRTKCCLSTYCAGNLVRRSQHPAYSAGDFAAIDSLRSTWSREENLQTKLQTNRAAQRNTGHHKPGSSRQNAEPEHTLSYCAVRTSMRILELENRGFESHSLRQDLLIYKAFLADVILAHRGTEGH